MALQHCFSKSSGRNAARTWRALQNLLRAQETSLDRTGVTVA